MKKKIAILSVGDLRHITMISLYTEFLERYNVEYEIICTSRYKDDVIENDNKTVHLFKWVSSTRISKLRKIMAFIKFRNFAKEIIKNKEFDFIIIWNENTALLFADILVAKYKTRYCVNIRDFGMDNYGILKIIKGLVVRSSAFSTFCTPSGVELLPKYNYTIMLNQDLKLMEKCKKRNEFKKENEKIVITYMGIINDSPGFRRIIRALGNDDRYIVCFYGPEIQLLSDFVKTNNFNNVILGAEFSPEKTKGYLENTDIINSYYGNNLLSLKHAVGVKESYGPQLRLPVLVDPETFWAEISQKYGFGFVIKRFDTLADDLYRWYHSLNFNNFDKRCQEYCDYVEKVNTKFYEECAKNLL